LVIDGSPEVVDLAVDPHVHHHCEADCFRRRLEVPEGVGFYHTSLRKRFSSLLRGRDDSGTVLARDGLPASGTDKIELGVIRRPPIPSAATP
jgi:hypothetical protein